MRLVANAERVDTTQLELMFAETRGQLEQLTQALEQVSIALSCGHMG